MDFRFSPIFAFGCGDKHFLHDGLSSESTKWTYTNLALIEVVKLLRIPWYMFGLVMFAEFVIWLLSKAWLNLA